MSNQRALPLGMDVKDPGSWLEEQTEEVRLVTFVENGKLFQRPRVEAGAFVDPSALLIGGVIVGPECYIGPFSVVRLDEKPGPEPLVIGAGSNLQDFSMVHSTTTSIGERVIVAHHAVVHGATIEDDVTLYIQAAADGGGTVIGAGSFLHRGSYVGKGIRIPRGRYVEPGRNVLSQSEAEALPEVPDKLLALRRHVLEQNLGHARLHRGF